MRVLCPHCDVNLKISEIVDAGQYIVSALLPIYARDILFVGPLGLGILRAAPGVGALFMSAVLTHSPPRPTTTPSTAANLFSPPVTPPLITMSYRLGRQPGSVSRVFRVRCRIVTC